MAPFRCGDTVLHRPSGEKWVVAYCDGDVIAPAGWPDCRARTSDCDLVTRVTDEGHRNAVAEWFRCGYSLDSDNRRAKIARLYPDAIPAAAKEFKNDR